MVVLGIMPLLFWGRCNVCDAYPAMMPVRPGNNMVRNLAQAAKVKGGG